MNQGHLQSAGIRVQRRRVRQCVASNDPIHRNMRWHQVIYIEDHTLCLALTRYGILMGTTVILEVCHTWGYSHSIVYLQCTINKDENVFAYFWKAMNDIPSRICSDKGGENTMVCYFMVSQRRTGRGSHIACRSTHNQRIEVMCISVLPQHMGFSTIIMEDQSMLDIDSLFVLHCVFLPLINRSLKGFAGAWNHHPLCNERMWSQKIWINGMI